MDDGQSATYQSFVMKVSFHSSKLQSNIDIFKRQLFMINVMEMV